VVALLNAFTGDLVGSVDRLLGMVEKLNDVLDCFSFVHDAKLV
jgi:uncharacterized protein YkvS